MNENKYEYFIKGKNVALTDKEYKALQPNFDYILEKINKNLKIEKYFKRDGRGNNAEATIENSNFFLMPISLSGNVKDKKIRVKFNNRMINKKNVFIIGYTFFDNKIIYAFFKVKDGAYGSKTYSSLWISINSMHEILTKKVLVKEGSNNSFLLVKDEDLNLIVNDNFLEIMKSLNKKLRFYNLLPVEVMQGGISFDQNDSDFESEILLIDNFNSEIKSSKIMKTYLKRNQDIVDLKRSEIDYCENCLTENTFIDKKDKMYFEIHHLIPYNQNTQKYTKKNLDTYYNLVSLCPSCHKMIHLAENETSFNIIENLVKQKENFLEKYEINNLDDLNKMYLETYGLESFSTNYLYLESED